MIAGFVLLSLFCVTAVAQPSNGNPIVEGKDYALHKVQKGETLYGVCRKYEVDMTETAVVNKLGGNGLNISIGQTLVIPLYAKKQPAKKEAKLAEEGYVTHVVKQGETLFSISRNYNGVTPQMLRDKNNLKSDTLKINQQLLVPQEFGLVKNGKEDGKEMLSSSERRAIADSEKKYKATENAATAIEISRGIASWIDNDSDENQKNFYALHKHVPIGSMLKVRNLMNNRAAYVKVIGKLPEIEENKNIVITLSAAAARELRVFDAKFLVELTIPGSEKTIDESKR